MPSQAKPLVWTSRLSCCLTLLEKARMATEPIEVPSSYLKPCLKFAQTAF